jgi:hypothetical protein
MATTWIRLRRIAFIPARPTNISAPADWVDRVWQRVFFDPSSNGDDCSLRAYYPTISYGKAQLEADRGRHFPRGYRTPPLCRMRQYGCFLLSQL